MKRATVLALAVILLNSCALYKERIASNASLLSTETIEEQYGPKGELVEIHYQCSVPGPTGRRMLVYLPEGYGDSSRRFPVLYLLHGARGNETSWITKGDVLQLADSLYSNGLAEPAILVFTNGNSYKDDADFGNSRRKGAVECLFGIEGATESAYLVDVVSTVDSTFRTIPDKQHRAIAGMSIGGLQSMYISARNPESFGFVGLFSPLCKPPVKPGDYAWFYKDLKDNLKSQFENAPDVYDIEVGRADILYSQISDYVRYLYNHDYPFQYYEYSGGHEWYNWKKSFCNFSNMIFRD